MVAPPTPVCIFWFRRDLRSYDNRGFFEALSQEGNVLPVFIFDTEILEKLPVTDRRVSFLVDTLNRLQNTFRESGSGLLVRQGKPLEVFQKLSRDFAIKALYTNHDYEPYAIARDREVAEWCKESGIVFKSFKDQVVFEKSEILNGSGLPYKVFSPYMKAWKKRLLSEDLAVYPSEKHLDKLAKVPAEEPVSEEQIGFERAEYDVPGLEVPTNIIGSYDQTRDFPAQNGTSRLSVHLRFGTISARGLTRVAKELNEKYYNELIWREFYMMILYQFPDVVQHNFRRELDGIPWRNSEADFERWKQGTTGVPLVDAGMRELNATGFMHNRVRMMTACFLSKHLLIDWRWGEAYFAEKLLDFELSSNNGGWQWAAGTGVDAAPYFRIFSADSQTKRFDPELKYIRRWVPEVGSLEYPEPMVDVKAARKRAIDTFAEFLNTAGPA